MHDGGRRKPELQMRVRREHCLPRKKRIAPVALCLKELVMLLFRLFTFENCGLVQMMQQMLGPIADGVAGTHITGQSFKLS